MRLLITLVAAMGVAAPAAAGYVDALEAYNAGDLQRARVEFESMARLGHVTSQHNLAIMLLRGEGGPALPVDAFGWFALAAEAGYEPAQKIHAQMALLATPDDLARAEALRGQFGLEASVERLAGRVDCFQSLRLEVTRPDGTPAGDSANRKGRLGWVLTEVDANQAGEIRDARAIGGVNAKDLADDAVAVLQYDWRVATSADRNASRFGVLPVTFREARIKHSPVYRLFNGTEVEGFPSYSVDDTLLGHFCSPSPPVAARQQVTCWLMSTMDLSIAEPDRQAACHAISRMALAGEPEAAVLVGSVLAGSSDSGKTSEGLTWWEVAAQNGSLVARVRVVDALLGRDALDAGALARAQDWMEAIIAEENDWGLKHVIAHLATHPDQRIRDPERALHLLPRIEHRGWVDPQRFEIRAAAHAGLGHFREARLAQEKAIRSAEKRAWDTESMARRLEIYEAGGTWLGDLIHDVESGSP